MIKKRTTIADIARDLKMAPSTVSRALGGQGRISPATRAAVQDAARRLNYRPNSLAASLRSGSSRLIGVMMPRIDRSFFASVVRAIEEAMGPAGYSIIVMQNNEQPEQEANGLEALLRVQVDGIIASLSRNTTDFGAFREVIKQQTPLILFDRVNRNLNASCVTIDDQLGAYLATQHLLEQGCRYPVHLAGPQHLNIYGDRLAGFKQAIEDAGLPFNPHQQVLMVEHNAEGGRQAAQHLLERNVPPDAIFSSSDWAAVGAMRYAIGKGLRVPEDIAFVGFANEPFTAHMEPPLSSVDQLSNEIGTRTAELMLATLAGKNPAEQQQIIIPPRLVVRQSSLRR